MMVKESRPVSRRPGYPAPMLDPNLFVNHPEVVRQSLLRRGMDPALADPLVALNVRRRALQKEGDDLRQLRNQKSQVVGQLMKSGQGEQAEVIKAEVRGIGERTSAIEAELTIVADEERTQLLGLPNLVDPLTPDGTDDKANPVVRSWGTPRVFDFPPRPHDEVATALGMYDPDRAAKLSGARFAVLSGALARMERALVSLFCDIAEGNGYREVQVPYMVTRETMTGTGQLPKFEEDLFKISGGLAGQDAYLIPTAEVPVTNLHRDEILDEEQLPVRYHAFTPCFRSEAGSAGRDTRGLVRVHQFHKVELVWITRPEDSAANLDTLVDHAESLLRALELPFHTVARCAGDVGFGGSRGYDIEVWLPGQAAYREISSCTNFGDFQARRLKLRFKREKKNLLCHTLNGSALAVGRTLVAILENYQQADGSVIVPVALRPYLGGMERIVRG